MPFLTDLHLSDVEGSDKLWELTDLLAYYWREEGETIVVPRGFRCDLASIPRLLRPFFSRYGRHTKAAVIHDWLYNQRWERGRIAADRAFLAAMRDSGVPSFRRRAYYLAVLAFGWGAWIGGEPWTPTRETS